MWRLSMMMVMVAACGRLGFDEVGISPDAAEVAPFDLLVSRADDRMSGPASLTSRAELPSGTLDLSLREALAIAGNHPGPDVIRFDPTALPPGTVITTAVELVVGDTGTTLDAAGAGITLAGAAGYTGALLRVAGDDAVLDGLRLVGGGIGVVSTASDGLVLRRFEIADPALDAIELEDCARVTIEDNRIDRAGGIALHARGLRDGRLQRNVIALRTGGAQLPAIELERATKVAVLENRVGPGSALHVALVDAMDNELTGNLLDRGDAGLVLMGVSQRNLVFRNVVIAPATDSIRVELAAENNTLVHNTLFLAPDITDQSAKGTVEFNLVSSRPGQFVRPETYDFHLVAGDPAIDAAANRGRDLLPGQPELFLGQAPDLGAFESN